MIIENEVTGAYLNVPHTHIPQIRRVLNIPQPIHDIKLTYNEFKIVLRYRGLLTQSLTLPASLHKSIHSALIAIIDDAIPIECNLNY